MYMIKKILYIAIISLFSIGLNAQIDRSKAPKSGEAPEINLPEANIWTLQNGLKVILVENNKLPTVRFKLYFDYGRILEGEKAGFLSIMGEMMSAGTKKMRKEKLHESIELLGAYLNTSSNSISVSTLKKNYEKAFSIMSDVLLEPSFPEKEFKKEIILTISGLEANEKNTNYIARRLKNVMLYGKDHPYGEIVTPETVNNITLDDVKDFYYTHFKPNIAYLVINGDISKDEVDALLSKHLLNWKSEDVYIKEYDNPKNPSETEIDFINVDAATQANICIANLESLKRTDSDYFAAKVGSGILGGSATARLFMNLREDKAYTYGSYCSLGSDRYISSFSATASVRNNVVDSAIVEIFKEIRKIRDNNVTKEELKRQKNSFFGSFAMSLESPSTIANFYLNEQIYNLPKGYYANYLKHTNKVKAKDVKAVMRKHLKPDNAKIIVVGKASELLPRLEKLNYKINFFDIYGNPTEKPNTILKVDTKNVSVYDIISDYAEAIGGKEKLLKVNTLEQKYTMQMSGFTVDGELKYMLPHKTSVEMKMNGETIIKNAFNGKVGYTSQQGDKANIEEKEIAKYLSVKSIFPWMYFDDKSYEGVVEGIIPVNNSDAYKIRVKVGADYSYYYFDKSSKFLVKTEEIEVVDGEKVTEETQYLNYTDFEGILFPSKLKTSVNSQIMDINIISIKINEGVSESDFE